MEIFERANTNEGPWSLGFIKFLGKTLSTKMLRKGSKYFILKHLIHFGGLLLRTVKGWVSSYLKAKKLIFHNSVDIGKRHEIPGSETKECIACSKARSTSFTYTSIPLPPTPIRFCGGDAEGPRWMLNMQQIYILTEKSHGSSLPCRDTSLLYSKLCPGVSHTICETLP